MDNILFLEEAADYWKAVYETTEMKDQIREGESYSAGVLEEMSFQIAGDSYEKISKITRKDSWTSYVFFLCTVRVSLALALKKEEKIIGVPSHFKTLESDIINPCLPLVFPVKEEATFKETLLGIKKEIETLHRFQVYSLQEKNQIVFKKNKEILFPVNMVMEGLHRKDLVDNYKEYPDTKLGVCLKENSDSYQITLRYNTTYFNKQDIKNYIAKYEILLHQCLENLDVKLSNLELINPDEQRIIRNQFNATRIEYEKEATLVDLFERQVNEHPQDIAVEWGDESATYEQINARANTIANVLREYNISTDCIVPILVKRSIDTLICMIAVLKAGGAYLPVDTEYPAERISYMLTHSKAKVILAHKELLDKVQTLECETILVDDKQYRQETKENPKYSVNCHNLAYVLYTSGSTGKPKGVMIEHQQVHNFLIGMNQAIDFSDYHNVLSLTTVSFDIFGLESIVSLLAGKKITISKDGEDIDGEKVARMMTKGNVDVIQCTPSRVKILLQTQEFRNALKQIKAILVGGEAFPENLLKELQEFDNLRIFNMYGPTETTIWSTVKDVTKEEQITIGKPIANTRLYVLDSNKKMVGIGEEGELCIGGDGVGRGYLYAEEMTNERFITLADGERVYRTGDLAKWCQDGDVSYVGRMDFQVKIRGYRVELGEIENLMLRVPGVKEAVVTAKGRDSEKELVAYYVEESPVDQELLKSKLEEKLPSYMVPSWFMRLEKFPLTLNGKIDKKSLPEITKVTTKEYV
ncbi:non-ribosomal peptide synthetase, partial [Anaerosporobacter sp.]